LKELPAMCQEQSLAFLRVAALAPALAIETPRVTSLGAGVSRVEVDVVNRGYLPTHILESARNLDFNEALYIDCALDGLTLVDPGQRHLVIGHLEGWGRGLHSGQAAPHFLRSTGNGHTAHASFLVRGKGRLTLRAGSCRVGFCELTIAVG
jgi:hypothetical protein